MIRGIVFSLLLATSAVVSAAVTETPAAYRRITLENRFMALEFLPDSLGRVDQITLKSTGKKLLINRTLNKVSVDPLYEFYRNNSFGCGENFWKNYVANRDGRSKVSHPDGQTVVFENKWYGGLSVDLRRTSKLLPDETLFTFEAEVVNRDRKKDFYLAPWYSFTPADAASTRLLIPAKGGRKTHVLGNVKMVQSDIRTDGPSGMFFPVRNWMATLYTAEKIALAIIVPPEEFFPDGAFYTWHGKAGNIAYRSMEAILNGKNLAPGAERRFRCNFAVFYGVKNVLDIAGLTAIDAAISGRNLILTLSPARKIAAGRLIVNIQSEKTVKRFESLLPELIPGKGYDFSFVPDGEKIIRITGKLPDGSEFDLLDVNEIYSK
ncbi:MAG: hypothetical protein J6W00_11680 [Lentisphaeria bacterium]|nr:hypothetical protein [Lentisphaeria bacterium]